MASRQSRKRHIPGTQTLRWPSPESRVSKPHVRRPMTACEACRTAKVKCNGQRVCDRCKDRKLHCTYTKPSLKETGTSSEATRNMEKSIREEVVKPQSLSNSQAMPEPSAENQALPGLTSTDFRGDGLHSHDGDLDILPPVHTSNGIESWGEEEFNHALEEFDWVFSEPDLSLDVSRSAPV
ncbi:hypothetical protein N7462_002452 [Penicillium macrosclerotiorum]|uniref:uncharacterized protein n=1 Tax=Penicillium macrosclerotiorum TaxID=303699 RepID=UPI002546EECF|nr:uncharacterized protein N7462_002452 [Penicillium macrosclerotiorum]KAJ5693029.1 hypothetical protein N7462_002452 [Penicillium macrosclerotiorum]